VIVVAEREKERSLFSSMNITCENKIRYYYKYIRHKESSKILYKNKKNYIIYKKIIYKKTYTYTHIHTYTHKKKKITGRSWVR